MNSVDHFSNFGGNLFMSDYSLVLEGKYISLTIFYHFGGKCIFYTFLPIYIGYAGKYLFISFLN